MSSEEKLTTTKAIIDPAPSPLWKKLGWMVILWSSSVLALFAVSLFFRFLMTAAGMKVK